MRRRELAAALAALLLLGGSGGCGDAPPESGSVATEPDRDPARAAPGPELVYERSLVFLAPAADSTYLMPWLLESRTGEAGVERRSRAWLARGTGWEAFLDQRWTTPPTRAPWRILPHGPMRLVVGDNEGLERLLYTVGDRELELVLEAVLTEWRSRRGEEIFRLQEGAVVLGGTRSDGLVLDLSRAHDPGEAPGDWFVLISGDSLQVVLHELGAGAAGPGGNPWAGWARLDFRNLVFPELDLAWTEARPFDAARRDVPVGWEVSAADGSLTGALSSITAQLEAGEGSGPLLPVDGLMAVEGTLTVEGAEYPVRGLLRHTQR